MWSDSSRYYRQRFRVPVIYLLNWMLRNDLHVFPGVSTNVRVGVHFELKTPGFCCLLLQMGLCTTANLEACCVQAHESVVVYANFLVLRNTPKVSRALPAQWPTEKCVSFPLGGWHVVPPQPLLSAPPPPNGPQTVF